MLAVPQMILCSFLSVLAYGRTTPARASDPLTAGYPP
jgi:hypothetical protein